MSALDVILWALAVLVVMVVVIVVALAVWLGVEVVLDALKARRQKAEILRQLREGSTQEVARDA